MKLPAPNVLVMALQEDSTLVSTRIYSVLPDGRELIETAVYPGKNGLPVMRTNYFTSARLADHASKKRDADEPVGASASNSKHYG